MVLAFTTPTRLTYPLIPHPSRDCLPEVLKPTKFETVILKLHEILQNPNVVVVSEESLVDKS